MFVCAAAYGIRPFGTIGTMHASTTTIHGSLFSNISVSLEVLPEADPKRFRLLLNFRASTKTVRFARQ